MFRIAMDRKDIEIVAINNLSDNVTLAHLLKYDSSYGTLNADVSTDGPGYIVVNGKKIRYFQEKDPAKIPWGEEKVDIVLEATGVFNDKENGGKHLRDTVKKVIFTAAAKGSDVTMVMGVNEKSYDPAKTPDERQKAMAVLGRFKEFIDTIDDTGRATKPAAATPAQGKKPDEPKPVTS